MGEASVLPTGSPEYGGSLKQKHRMAALMVVPTVRVHSSTKGHRHPAHIRKFTPDNTTFQSSKISKNLAGGEKITLDRGNIISHDPRVGQHSE